MITVQSTNNKFKMTAQLDKGGLNNLDFFGYTRSNSEAVLEVVNPLDAGIREYKFTYLNTGDTRTVVYTSDPTGKLVMSMRKWINLCDDGNNFTLLVEADISGTIEQITLTVNVLAGVSYNDIIAPIANGYEQFTQIGGASHQVVPPNVILGNFGFSPVVESSLANSVIPSTQIPNAGFRTTPNGNAITPSGSRKNQVQVFVAQIGGTTLYYKETDGNNDTLAFTEITKPDTCELIALMQWTSLTGAVRKHMLRVKEISGNVDSRENLLSLHDGFKSVKNVSNSFKVYLEGLTPYSYWYYSDMLFANNLKAYVISAATMPTINVDSYFNEVECVDNNKSIMVDSKGLMTFEATIKYKHYDSY